MGGFSFIEKIRSAGFELSLDGSNLAVRPASKLSHKQREFICCHKLELVAALRLSEVALPESAGDDLPVANDDAAAADLRSAFIVWGMALSDAYGDSEADRAKMLEDLLAIPEEQYEWHISYFKARVAQLRQT